VVVMTFFPRACPLGNRCDIKYRDNSEYFFFINLIFFSYKYTFKKYLKIISNTLTLPITPSQEHGLEKSNTSAPTMAASLDLCFFFFFSSTTSQLFTSEFFPPVAGLVFAIFVDNKSIFNRIIGNKVF
jgi:hypothetical protein